MEYDDEQARRSKVVVDTPTSRREVTHTESVRNDRGGISGATVGVIVVVAIALITVVVLFLMNGQQANDNANANLAAQQQQPIVQQPAPQQQPPIIIQQPAAAPQQPVVISQPPASGDTAPVNTSNDGAVQMAVDKKISDDPTLSALGVTATVLDGKVTVTGTVKSEALKSQLDKVIRSVKGVKQVDNQITVMAE
ncbi:MAG TPA: BON domain-containing protein [Pyrinomonadaceae bacterium]|jgi:uncharacterized protein HemX|nr:BON domain-containing protein [Pyrinomonadaceae bacterium]